ncbi:putative permease YjgP/YjgQ family protein [Mariniblastus fucicola]|uniref:Putative permease YjgP/YjgQ family protein n=2 Tax=Mariniblastus fucicola TaxID=980251 RepID=A0A5B9PEB9_9BACT|nr:putative permease YjgP/YjgQ family protein [Mariniblastus fucicola]
MLLVGLAQKAREYGIGPDIVMQLIPFLVPEALMFAIPATSLFSVCVVFGRMAADNEVTALESLGLSKSMVVMPALLMAFGLSLGAVWLNDVAYAWSHFGIERVVLQSTDRIVYSVLQQEGSFKNDQFSIEVGQVDGRTLIQPIVTVNSGANIRVAAASGSLTYDPDTHSLQFRMDHGSIDSDSNFRLVDGEHSSIDIPLRSPDDLAKDSSPSHLYLSQITGAVVAQQRKLESLESQLTLEATAQWMTGDIVGLSHEGWAALNRKLDDARYRLARLKVVPHRRWANGFSCLAFAIIGVPVALRLRTGNYATTFGACFVPILLLYYPLFMFGLNGAKMGTLPAWSVWLGNVACALVGVLLLRHELRK